MGAPGPTAARVAAGFPIDSTGLRSFFDALAAVREHVTPVIGAGLAAEAGAPSSAELSHALCEAAGKPELSGDLSGDLFSVADHLAVDRSESWVQEEVAKVVGAVRLVPTPVLMALSKCNTELIFTTNYDLAIELAAEAAGKQVESLTLADTAVAMQPPAGVLRVLHLHGVASKPNTIVLTKASYEAAAIDDRLTMVTRWAAVQNVLLFLGHSLAPREQHLRRDIRWARNLLDQADALSDRKHMLLAGAQDSNDPVVVVQADELLAATGVHRIAFVDPDHEHAYTSAAAHVVAGPAAAELADRLPTLADERIDRHYVPMMVARAEEVASDLARGGFLYRTYAEGSTSAADLDALERRLLIVAAGGHGKTQELHQIGLRSVIPAMYKAISSVDAGPVGLEMDAVFVSWMTDASSYRPETPQLTAKRLREHAFVFLLDGLDEVRADRRDGALRLIADVAARYPQHRWVIASRQLPAELPPLDMFRAWTLVPDRTWLAMYAARRAVPMDRVDEVISGAPGITDVATIPIYAAGIMKHAMGMTDTPATPRELVLSLAEEDLEADTRIIALPELVQVWLDRVALFLELFGRTEITLDELNAVGLHDDLPGVAPTPEMLIGLTVRTLLLSDGGTARFSANVIQEARAARALVNADAAGLVLLNEYVLLKQPDPLATGGLQRVVRASWANTLSLLLPDAPPPWREAIAAADPLLAARAASVAAPADERHGAIWEIWRAYLDRRVWLDHQPMPGRHDDASALIMLARDSTPEGFVDELLRAAVDREKTQRANALEVLAGIKSDRAPQLLKAAITDREPVVRRRAAIGAVHLKLHALTDDLAAQAAIDPDDLAAQTLIDAALDLADDNRVLALALDAPPRLAERTRNALTLRLPRARLLELARTRTPFDALLLQAVIEGIWRASEAATWTADEVAALAHVVAAHEAETRGTHEVESPLQRQPLAALDAWIRHPVSQVGDYLLWRLISSMTNETLRQAQVALSGPADSTAPALEPAAAGAAAVPETVELARRIIAEIIATRTAPAPPRPCPRLPAGRWRNWSRPGSGRGCSARRRQPTRHSPTRPRM